ncbi:hypothetical protein B0T26DRAFT_681019 [Lasiosphaeria miniovina]|uniref:Uncharacterized protein n=1 Tax=Lasiosphaeria miniovina TaxID=1954250 RepID=A0AA40DJ75_9PEZI|nr:uncharacterized protein B0T26DRAFT_681019 [Lasiosphaeria miniovina]KAK0703326.1 hypothetical protein B0T26DRAFT_681019 [Lasiosphaeria miniovina]
MYGTVTNLVRTGPAAGGRRLRQDWGPRSSRANQTVPGAKRALGTRQTEGRPIRGGPVPRRVLAPGKWPGTLEVPGARQLLPAGQAFLTTLGFIHKELTELHAPVNDTFHVNAIVGKLKKTWPERNLFWLAGLKSGRMTWTTLSSELEEISASEATAKFSKVMVTSNNNKSGPGYEIKCPKEGCTYMMSNYHQSLQTSWAKECRALLALWPRKGTRLLKRKKAIEKRRSVRAQAR